MTNRRSPVLTCWPSMKARFCRKPSTRDTRLTVLTAWTRPTKVPACVTLFKVAADTVTAGGVGGADAWSAVGGRSQLESVGARMRIPPRPPQLSGRRIVEFPPIGIRESRRRLATSGDAKVPWAAKPCQWPQLQQVAMAAPRRLGLRRGPSPKRERGIPHRLSARQVMSWNWDRPRANAPTPAPMRAVNWDALAP